MRDYSRHGIAATVVFAEHLSQESPDGRDRAIHSVPKLDAMVVKDFLDAVLGQNGSERKSLVARKAGAYCI